jgi:hypothetical protein
MEDGGYLAPPRASSSHRVDGGAEVGSAHTVPAEESHTAVGFEFKIENAVADPAQPIVFDRLTRARRAYRAHDSTVSQVIQLLVACRIEAFAQHWLPPGAPSYAQPC